MKIVTNTTDRVLLVRLRSCRTVHLGAGASTEVDAAEINGNPRIARLIERRMCVVEGTEPAAGERHSKRLTSPRKTTRKSATASATNPAQETTTTSTGDSR